MEIYILNARVCIYVNLVAESLIVHSLHNPKGTWTAMIKGNVTRAGLTKVLAFVFLVIGLGCLYGGNYAHG